MSDLATAGTSAAGIAAASGVLVLRSARARRRAAPAVRARARLRRPRAHGARTPATTTRSPARDNAQALVRNAGGIELLSNVCRHRQAIMLQRPRQRAEHRLPAASLDLRPQGRAARRAAFRRQAVPQPRPHAAAELERPAVRRPARRRRRPRGARRRSDFDFSGYRARPRRDRTSATTTGRSFIEVYLEDYHVGPFHPGLGQFVTCDDLQWEFGDWDSVQTVGVNNGLAKPGTRDVRALAQGGARLLSRRDPAARRDLAHLLPERHGRVVSARARGQHADPARPRPDAQRRRVLLSRGDRAVRARVRRGRAGGVHRDGERGRRDRRAHGRRPQARCTRRAAAKSGPYQSPMEDGMQHFHEFYRREMEAHLAQASG